MARKTINTVITKPQILVEYTYDQNDVKVAYISTNNFDSPAVGIKVNFGKAKWAMDNVKIGNREDYVTRALTGFATTLAASDPDDWNQRIVSDDEGPIQFPTMEAALKSKFAIIEDLESQGYFYLGVFDYAKKAWSSGGSTGDQHWNLDEFNPEKKTRKWLMTFLDKHCSTCELTSKHRGQIYSAVFGAGATINRKSEICKLAYALGGK